MKTIPLPALDNLKLGKWLKGDKFTKAIVKQIANYLIPPVPAPEVTEQQQRYDAIQAQIDVHPLQKLARPNQLLKKQQQRLQLKDLWNYSCSILVFYYWRIRS